jgi:hypothetical protein
VEVAGAVGTVGEEQWRLWKLVEVSPRPEAVTADGEQSGGRERSGGGVVPGEGKKERKNSPRWYAPLIAVRGGGRWWRSGRSHRRKTVVVPWSGHWTRGLGTAARTVRVIGGPHGVLIFLDFPKLGQICKFKIDAFHCSKNSQILRDTRLEYSSQLSRLCLLQIPKK